MNGKLTDDLFYLYPTGVKSSLSISVVLSMLR